MRSAFYKDLKAQVGSALIKTLTDNNNDIISIEASAFLARKLLARFLFLGVGLVICHLGFVRAGLAKCLAT